MPNFNKFQVSWVSINVIVDAKTSMAVAS